MESGFRLVLPCLLGLEGLVAEELREMGAARVEAENGRVFCAYSPEMTARANIRARYAERVLVELGHFEAKSFEALFQGVKALPWTAFLSRNDAFPVRGRCLSSALMSVPDCQSIVKKAVVESLKTRWNMERFPEDGPKYQIQFLIMKDQVSILLDASGAALHKRGYRKNSTEAPIRETLAAAMAKLARVRPDGTVFDPFCGSGTMLIEAAMLAMRIAPGVRRHFAAEQWRQIPGGVWEAERAAARALEDRGSGFRAFGSDIDPAAVELARENVRKAGLADRIEVTVRDVRDFQSDAPYGCVLTNPPYGERLLDRETAAELYRVLGQTVPKRHGWSCTVISPEERFEALFGRRADKKRKLYNGMIRCDVYQYFRWEDPARRGEKHRG